MSNPVPDKLSTLVDSIFQEAVDEAIEQHRSLGHAIAVSDDDGNVIEIQPTDITPKGEKLQRSTAASGFSNCLKFPSLQFPRFLFIIFLR